MLFFSWGRMRGIQVLASVTNFLKELRRRNVFKVGVAYAIIAWLLMQLLMKVGVCGGGTTWNMTSLLNQLVMNLNSRQCWQKSKLTWPSS